MLYFATFASFKESMTLDLAQRSFKVIHFGGNRKPVYYFIQAVIISKVVLAGVREQPTCLGTTAATRVSGLRIGERPREWTRG